MIVLSVVVNEHCCKFGIDDIGHVSEFTSASISSFHVESTLSGRIYALLSQSKQEDYQNIMQWQDIITQTQHFVNAIFSSDSGTRNSISEKGI